MPFEKVETQVDFPNRERSVLEFWERIHAFDKLREKNKTGPRWSFLDGPITANNPMGVHHAWGRTYKDAYQRYHAMLGQHLRYQNGFDCQGLWVEVEVEKELKLQSKRDIENLVPGDTFASIDQFVRLCKERVDKFARVQTDQSIRLGYWMDWDRGDDWQKPPDQRRSYFTMSEENNYTIWTFLKKCHQRGLVYRGYDAMPWCPRCSVGLSQMEMSEGYQMVAHRSVFVRFPLRGRPPHPQPLSPEGRGETRLPSPLGGEGLGVRGENLLVWTTTPWTLTSNVAAAVNPELTYLKVLHKEQIYYVAKGAFTARRLEEQFKRKEWVSGVPKLKALEQVFKEKGGYEIVGEVRGAEMVGWEYDGPFDELPAQQHPSGYPAEIAGAVRKASGGRQPPVDTTPRGADAPRSPRDLHRVIAWKDVGETEGTGIVHIAPGCGKEDFLLGREQGLPPIAPLDEFGVFVPGFGALSGKSAVDPATTDAILDNLKEKGVLLAVEQYPHNYPHCWRCKTELLFRLVDEWFINMKWRDEIMRVVDGVTFLPESINGKARELDWLRNMGDWMISKKRFWGLSLPIWLCPGCGNFDVIGSREELKERAVEGWDQFAGHSPHRPWVDQVMIECSECRMKISRIPDVGNPWLDAGIVPFSTMGYNRDRAYWERWFPADFITESFPGQFRNWFYAILAMSTMMEGRAPMKVLLGHGLVRDQWDRPMHKASGNSIPFEGAADEGYNLTDPKGKTAHYPPMSADLIRWLFARSNPAANIDFGPGLAEELRSKFILKIWNTYAFFCNLAGIPPDRGGFDRTAAEVPARERPDMDRWVLSDLQRLARKAREAFESYNVMAFCLEAEAFVDDKLSNWYVRRNKRRFWDGDQAAYQTLYTVLTTLAKLFAPVMPFLSEEMYQNLKNDGDPESVHLCEYPTADESLIDERLSTDMAAAMRLASLGSAARNSVKIKVRQPLAEMKVQPANEDERRAAERFADLIGDELNIKKLTLHDAATGPLLRPELKPNLKSLGPKYGQFLNDVEKGIAALDPWQAAALVEEGKSFDIDVPYHIDVRLDPEDLIVTWHAPDGWAGVRDKGTQVMVKVWITEELAQEGMAREVVRRVNDERKNAKLEMENRIELSLETPSPKLGQAIEAHRGYIADETLVVNWAKPPLNGEWHRKEVTVEGQGLTVALRKV